MAIKKLSYGGRLQLLKSILMRIKLFWSGLFFIRKSVIAKTEYTWTFLLTGTEAQNHGAKVSWSEVCLPMEEGD